MNVLAQAPYFTKQNLALVIEKKPDATDYFLKQSLKKGQLIALKKGFYIAPAFYERYVKEPLAMESYLEYIANVLREPSYVSLEYVLAKAGFIPESVSQITSITIKTARTFNTSVGDFSYRQIKSGLYNGYDQSLFEDKIINIASLPKALFDLLYLRKFSSTSDMREFIFTKSRFNWEIFDQNSYEKFAQFTNQSQSSKMMAIEKQIKKYVNSR